MMMTPTMMMMMMLMLMMMMMMMMMMMIMIMTRAHRVVWAHAVPMNEQQTANAALKYRTMWSVDIWTSVISASMPWVCREVSALPITASRGGK
jgi:hypothetical protein